ncbi:MAG: hypothetical protein ABW145_16635, partial [Candidatus Thiodiazotropha sp.]
MDNWLCGQIASLITVVGTGASVVAPNFVVEYACLILPVVLASFIIAVQVVKKPESAIDRQFLVHLLFFIGLVFLFWRSLCDEDIGLGTWFAALGTWLLAWIGFWGVVTAIKAKQREILSGLKIGRVDPSGVAWIKNTSKEWIKFKVSLNRKKKFYHKNEHYAKAWVNYSNGCDDLVCDKIKRA